jgi:SAM-dependent methyltransferase
MIRMLRVLVLVLVWCAAAAHAQVTADEVEKRIAALPLAERSYERFRFWATQLPREEQERNDLFDRYRAYLTGRGFSATDAAREIEVVKTQGERSEVERWNRILTSDTPRFNTKPNAFLVEMATGRKPGRALDVGMGQGRNAIWLAQQGWDVTGFDPAEKAVALAEQNAAKLGVRLHTEIKTVEAYDFGEQRWDLILLSYIGARDFNDKVQRALKPGSIVVVEAFHRDATKEHPIGGAVVFETGELPKLFPNLRAVRYEEPVAKADFGLEMVRVVRYCGERPH